MHRNFAWAALLVVSLASTSFAATVRYVRAGASPGGDGTSWATAYPQLQDAIDAAPADTEIWVAAGTYQPTEDSSGNPSVGLASTFTMRGETQILGGFAGTETARWQRRPLVNVTTLDGRGVSRHVVLADQLYGVTSAARIDGFTITNGFASGGDKGADSIGGGMLVLGCSPAIVNCRFVGNRAVGAGGGLWSDGTGILIVNCRFDQNIVTGFEGLGGGLACQSSPILMNCLIVENQVWQGGAGGGAYLGYDGEEWVEVWNCTIANNSCTGAGGQGGGLALTGGTTVVGAIIWGNSAETGAQIDTSAPGSLTVSFSDVQGSWGGSNNLNVDPQFAAAGNYHLQRTSPCINFNTSTQPLDLADLDEDGETDEALPLDLDLTPRATEGEANAGAYQALDCNLNDVGDYAEIAADASLDCNLNGTPDECEGLGRTVFVNADASGVPDGRSWNTAFRTLQDGLCVANQIDADGALVEVWVARGIYSPRRDESLDRLQSFRPAAGVHLLGGFGGWEEDASQRDPLSNPTLLSGDLAGNDGLPFSGFDDNAVHVVTIGAGGDNRLSGFIIRGGYASPTVTREPTETGGGVLVDGGEVLIDRCVFEFNSALDAGGAIYVARGGNVHLQSCRLVGNAAGRTGGAIASEVETFVLMESCGLTGNSTTDGSGGAIAVPSGGEVRLINCVLYANTATDGGGAAAVPPGGLLTARNSVFYGGAYPVIQTGLNASLDVESCLVQGGFPGAFNIDADPLLAAPAGYDGVLGTRDDSFVVEPGSPCIDMGDNDAALGLDSDVDGFDRLQWCRVDIGASESEYFLDCDSDESADACEIEESAALDCNANRRLDGCDISQGLADDCDENGVPDACQADRDGDGAIDDCDECPDDAGSSVEGPCGCGSAGSDADGDGVPDCEDNCERFNPDQIDTDGDGAGDACDSVIRFGNCPGNITVASPDAGGTNVTFDPPQPVDFYGEVRVTSSHQPGDRYPVGTTTVSYAAIDKANGVASCTFDIVVLPPDDANRPPPEDDCPELYQLNGGALQLFGIPFGCGTGCLMAVPLVLIGLAAMKRK